MATTATGGILSTDMATDTLILIMDTATATILNMATAIPADIQVTTVAIGAMGVA